MKVKEPSDQHRVQEQNTCRKLTLHKPEGTRLVGRPAIRWLDSVGDLKTVGFRNWRRKSQDQDLWQAIINETWFIMDCSARGKKKGTATTHASSSKLGIRQQNILNMILIFFSIFLSHK
jgi:hypothetical protein